MGGLYLRKALHVHEAWRLFSNVWLHDGVYPLIADIVGILGVGVPLEQKFGFGMSDS
jgi:membrane associated rhomboid family serine protease